jgi:hypothetical protein
VTHAARGVRVREWRMRLEERERARKQAVAPRACREGREGQAPFSIAHGPHYKMQPQ